MTTENQPQQSQQQTTTNQSSPKPAAPDISQFPADVIFIKAHGKTTGIRGDKRN
jgi:hypothetical protein